MDIFFLFQLVIALGASWLIYILIRSIGQSYKEKKIFRIIILILALLVVLPVAIFFILAVIGGLINIFIFK